MPMRRAACLGCLVLCGPVCADAERVTLLALAASVLQVEAPDDRGRLSLGSGVVVGPERVVSNCHVTRASSLVLVLYGGERWQATGQVVDMGHDLCLLQVPGLPAPPVSMGRAATLHVGDAVQALGYTGGMGLQRSAGEVVALHLLDGAPVVQSSNWFSSGASGGGLFDAAGHLVGVLTFRLRGGAAHYFAAPSEWVQSLLAQAEVGAWQTVQPQEPLALSYWQQPASGQPRFLREAAVQRDHQRAAPTVLDPAAPQRSGPSNDRPCVAEMP